MEVTRKSFSSHLPIILKNMSECCCVALDMEFSGIAARGLSGSPASHGNQSIQERYEEVKAAAETYQILQVGLTFVEEDMENGSYTLRPYNIHLSPLLDAKLEVERRWSYQSSAVEFLISNGFRMEAPFTEGITYISRDEEAAARRRLEERESKWAAIRDISVDQMDADAVQFLDDTRRYIDRCLENGEVNIPPVVLLYFVALLTRSVCKLDKEGYINVPSPDSADHPAGSGLAELTLSNYRKRLVHQLIRAEYPDLVSFGRSTFVQIVRYNKQREEELQESKMRMLQGRLAKQTGLRWIIEAMTGGDISGLDPWCFASVIDEPTAAKDEKVVKEYFDQLKQQLKSKRPVLVGHNIFADLVYLYRCFIGDLPCLVEDFQQAIHEMFPLVVDTKFMATHKSVNSKTSSSLSEVDQVLQQRKTPILVTDSHHAKYLNKKPLHEAGYDSLLTAQVFLRLSAELHERAMPKEEKKGPNLAPSGESPQLWTESIAKPTHRLIDIEEPNSTMSLASLNGKMQKHADPSGLEPTYPHPPPSSSSSSSAPRQQPVDWREPLEVARIRSIFAHPNKFDLLTDQTEDAVSHSAPNNIVKYNPILDPTRPLLDFPETAIHEKMKRGELIPRFDSDFWQTYGNKLRVYGTAEEVCELTKGKGNP